MEKIDNIVLNTVRTETTLPQTGYFKEKYQSVRKLLIEMPYNQIISIDASLLTKQEREVVKGVLYNVAKKHRFKVSLRNYNNRIYIQKRGL